MRNRDIELQVSRIADNARALAVALDRSPADQQVALEDLEEAAMTWSSRSDQVQGFQAADDGEPGQVISMVDRLDLVGADLQVAEVLIAAGVATEEVETDANGPQLLRASADRLDAHLSTVDGPGPTSAFAAPDVPEILTGDAASVTRAFGIAVSSIVDGTLAVLENAWSRLSDLVPDVVRKALAAFEAVLEAAPQVGRLVRLGLQALKRALLSLLNLLPQDFRVQVRDFASTWWSDHGTDLRQRAVAVLVGEGEVTDAIARIVDTAAAAEALNLVHARLIDLVARFGRLADTFGRILRALAAALAVASLVAVLVAAVAAWVPLAGALGYLLVAGSIILFARDYLDTGPALAGVEGVQRIAKTLDAQP